jgi:choline dehydrogenase-like flavoprotein
MPTDQRLRLKDFQRVQDSGRQTIEPGKHKAIKIAECYPLWRSAPQDIELVSEDKDFSLQGSPRPEQSDHGTPDQPAEIVHCARLFTDSQATVSRIGFAVGTGTRMGNDPSHSVVNSQCQVHGLENLFVIGASAFPTMAGYPPTATVAALAYRAADFIVRQRHLFH